MDNSFSSIHPELVCEWSDKNAPLTPEQITYGSKKLYWWKGSCGHEWKASAKSRSSGEKCPYCAGMRVMPGFNDLASKRPDLVSEWSPKNELKPTEVHWSSHKKAIWRDKYGHEWEAIIKNRVYGSGCPYCSHNKILEGFNDLASVSPDVAEEWSDRNLPLKPNMVTAFSNNKVWWKCKLGHEWNALINYERIPYDMLVNKIREKCKGKNYHIILLDEVTHVVDWEKAINEVSGHDHCKIVLFSSNRRIISPNLTAVQKGEYDVINALPLSFPEFITFQCFHEVTPPETPICEKRYKRFDEQEFTVEEIYEFYIKYGGLPVLKPEYMESEPAWVILDGSYSAAVTRDILEIGSYPGESVVTDPALLRSAITIMAKSIGVNISATWIGKQTQAYLNRITPSKTIESYLRAILNAHLFYVSERFDIKADQPLKTLAKYYIVDAGLHNYVTGIRSEDEGRLLENKVFFEFIRRGYDLYNGKIGRDEVHLIATKEHERVYVQVASKFDVDKEDSLIATLRKIRDHHPKLIIAFGEKTRNTRDGIMILNAMEFLMGASWSR